MPGETLSTHIDRDTADAVRKEAKKKRVTVSEWIRKAVKERLRGEEAQK